jgi:hypothetical protein
MTCHCNVLAVCAALRNILQTAGNRRRAFDSGAGEAVIAAMRTHATDQEMQATGCSALSNVFHDDTQGSHRAQLAAEVTRTIVAAMMAHASDGDVQRWACKALSHLTSRAKPCVSGRCSRRRRN